MTPTLGSSHSEMQKLSNKIFKGINALSPIVRKAFLQSEPKNKVISVIKPVASKPEVTEGDQYQAWVQFHLLMSYAKNSYYLTYIP